MNKKIERALSRLDKAISEINPIAVFGLFSGGHDSLSATYIASLHPSFTAAVHINTGIGVEATREFVRETCNTQKWKLLEYRAWENTKSNGEPDPMIYDDIVKKYGFPGPPRHGEMYVKLKERSLMRLERDIGASGRGKCKKRVLYVSGVRKQESERRMGTVEELKIESRRAWVSPILDWSKLDTTLLIEQVQLKRNPVVDLIHKSGECLCGAFAKQGELEELKLWDITRPVYERIKRLEKEVKEKGFQWGWEEKPPRCKIQKTQPGMLCHSCVHDEVLNLSK